MNFICTGCILTVFVKIYVHRELFKTIKIAYSEIINMFTVGGHINGRCSMSLRCVAGESEACDCKCGDLKWGHEAVVLIRSLIKISL